MSFSRAQEVTAYFSAAVQPSNEHMFFMDSRRAGDLAQLASQSATDGMAAAPIAPVALELSWLHLKGIQAE